MEHKYVPKNSVMCEKNQSCVQCKMTYYFWLDIRKVEAVYFPAKVGTHFADGLKKSIKIKK